MSKATSPHPAMTEADFGSEAEFREWLIVALRAQATRVALAIPSDSLADGVMLDAAAYLERLKTS